MSEQREQIQGATNLLGLSPDTPMPQLNLAGVDGVPAPEQLARTEDLSIHLPDFTEPQHEQPELQTCDLLAPGIMLTQPGAFAADPQLPDLNEYQHPYGVDIYNASAEAAALLLPEPFLGRMLVYEIVNGVAVNQDPLLPDLQRPALPLDVQMQERPGDLASGALEQMHMQPLYQQLDHVPYDEVFMEQSGINSTQRRHNELLMGGLDAVEKREE